jgi:hypothetical protein
MTTLQITGNGPEVMKFLGYARTLPFVSEKPAKEEEAFERIAGLPYTREERIAAIERAEEDYAAGRFVTSDVLKAKHPRI